MAKKYPQQEEAEESAKSKRKLEREMETGEGEADVYSEAGRDVLEDDDEISPAEAGFMEGASGVGHEGKCAFCGKPLSDTDEEVFARKIKGKKYLFDSLEHADLFEKKHKR